jgi:hypothetical protein
MKKENDMSTTYKRHHDVITKTAREALIGTGLELMVRAGLGDSYCYVGLSQDSDEYEIRIGMTNMTTRIESFPTMRVVSKQLISMEAAHAGDEQLIAATNLACMRARVEISAALRAAAARVDPLRS